MGAVSRFARACAGMYPDLRAVRVFIAAVACYLLLGMSQPVLQPGSCWYLLTALLYVSCFTIAIGAFAVQAGMTAREVGTRMRWRCES